MRRRVTLVIAVVTSLIALEVCLWAIVARDRLDATALSVLVRVHVSEVPDMYIPKCVAIEPRLFASATPRLQQQVRESLEAHGVELRIAEPTHSPETGGYLDRECVEYLIPPPELAGFNWPLISRAVIQYYGYDSNGDEVVMLQLGTRWLCLWHRSDWI